MKKHILLFILLVLGGTTFAQNDLLADLERGIDFEKFHQPAFKALKIGNLQSTKVADKGDLYLYVSHRFGSVKDGFSTFFGMDNASTKIQLAYGLFEGVQLGISRESLRQSYASSVKWRLMKQNGKFPFNVVAYSTININAELKKERYPNLKDGDRLSFAHQLLISRRINKAISLEFAPAYVRQNLVWEAEQKHDQIVLAAGGRLKVSKRVSLNADYAYNFSRWSDSRFSNPLTIGVDIDTGGHIFQLLFTNAQSANEPGFMSNAEGDWMKGEIYFGFNIVRVF
jgi:hypothetical protein